MMIDPRIWGATFRLLAESVPVQTMLLAGGMAFVLIVSLALIWTSATKRGKLH